MLIKSCSRREKEGAVDQRRSFSFSSLDFNSSFGPISTDEDENHPPPPLPPKCRDENEGKREGGDDLEFRVSFLEAALPFIGISSPQSNSYYSPPVDWPPAPNKRKVPLFLPVNHLLNTLEGPQIDDSIGDDHFQNSAISNDASKQLVLSMSRARSRTAADGGGVMNMMVKFRYVMSFRWMVASMLKIRRQQRQAVTSPSPSPSSSSTATNFNSKIAKSGALDSNQKMSRRRKNAARQQQVIGNAPEKSRSSVLLLRLGINLDAIRGMMVASDHHHGGSKSRHSSKSCPGSIKSSPLHHQGQGGGATTATVSSSLSGALVCSRDNNVQAAIAHCKKSFGRSEDFSF
nr:probable membrane-associated kinase regulator 1 [Ipomoea batatas]